MRKLLFSSLVLILLFPILSCKSTAVTILDWQTLYHKQVQKMAKSGDYDWQESYLSLVDFDLDGIPELIVGHDYIFGIYTISNNQVKELDIQLDGMSLEKDDDYNHYPIEMSTFIESDHIIVGLRLYKHKTTGELLYIGRGNYANEVAGYSNDYKINMHGKQIQFNNFVSYHIEVFGGVNYYVDGKITNITNYQNAIKAATSGYVEVELDVFNMDDPVQYDNDEGYIIIPSYDFTFPEELNARLAPSNWAAAGVQSAIELGLVPDDLDRGYHNAITREDFSRLAIQYLTVHYKVTKDQLPSTLKITKSNSAPFTDTASQDVILAYNLGVVAGKSEGLFVPNGVITRQEAAVMLGRLAKLTDKKSTNGTISYKDKSKIASWAQDSVKYVTGIKDKKSGSQVMGSAGSNQFNPQGIFTTEQAFITFKRLLES